MQVQTPTTRKDAKREKIKRVFSALLLSATIILNPPNVEATSSQACLHYAEAKRLYVMKGNGIYRNYVPKYEQYSPQKLRMLLSQDKMMDYRYLVDARAALIRAGGDKAVEECEKIVGLEQELKTNKSNVAKRPKMGYKTTWKDVLRTVGAIAFVYYMAKIFVDDS